MNWSLSFTLNRMTIILICLFLTAGCIFVTTRKEQPLARKGILDLRDWDFEKDGIAYLNGEWEFYWYQLLEPPDFSGPSPGPQPTYLKVPGIWNDYEIEGKKLRGDGHATYRLIIKINSRGTRFALKAFEAAHAYKMWVNSHEALSNGTVGMSRAAMKPQYLTQIMDIAPETETIELLLQVSNYVHRRGGCGTALSWEPKKRFALKRKNIS